MSSGYLFGLSAEDKHRVRLWVNEMRQWNNGNWTKNQDEQDGYEKALRHLLNALDSDGATI